MAFRGGRGGARGGMIKGATWEHDPTIKLDTKPSEDYPRHPNLKRPSPLSPHERTQVKYYRTLRDKIHRGPLYTHSTRRDLDDPLRTFGEDQLNEQYGREKKADFDPFLGVETYSMKYERKKRSIPLLSGRTYHKDFFPPELWPVLDGENENTAAKKAAKKNAVVAVMSTQDPSERTKAILERIERVAGAEGAEGEGEEALEDEEEEEEDYNYEDDEDEMGGDYDGEQYFENGEEDDDDGGDGGGGDDY
ncbi:hypothetical protein CJF32_00005348 [Rutstroemia sp. NJR-2017a WRK4]|nr:hypothetical protein CJF32_00005348 [Rutstroemia sp. NJR-2017a WRK4]